MLAIVLMVSLHQVRQEKPPWKSAWGRHVAEGREPSFAEHVKAGLWWGAAARAGIAAALLALSCAWRVGGGAPERAGWLRLASPGEDPLTPRAFWIGVGVVVLGAGAMRLPKMSQSLWGDESDALSMYVHGSFQPQVRGDAQCRLVFDQPGWSETFFGARHGANNHVLFSLASRACLTGWRALTGRSESDFAEWVARLPSLLAGLGSLATLALLLRRWGAPSVGVLAALVMALHPWHVRYSTEARGYAFMLLLLPLFVIALTDALERNRWRDWLLFALWEFLLMYAWGGIAYMLVLLNAGLVLLMAVREGRLSRLVRWLTAGLLSAGAFLSLYLPLVPQIASARKRLLWIKGLPMDEVWFHNLLAEPFTGIPFHEVNAANPNEMSWVRLFHESPVLTVAGFSLILAAFAIGLAAAWRRSKPVALLVTCVFLSAAGCVAHFKFVLGDELRVWYLIFTLPFVCLTVALGLWAVAGCAARWGSAGALGPARAVVLAGLMAVMCASLWPMNASLMARAEEDFKGAVAACGGQDAGAGAPGVFTIWLWRFSSLYAPRGETHARDAAALRVSMDRARAAGADLCVVVGFRKLAEQQNGDMLAMLEDPALFARTAVFSARESLHTLEVYRMRRAPR